MHTIFQPIIFVVVFLSGKISAQGGLSDQAPAAPGRGGMGGGGANWQQWEQWSGCSVTCDQGIKVRVRECDSPGACPGSRLEIDTCDSNSVCPRWTDWSQWTPCTSTCGYGAKERSRTCDQNACPGPNKDFAQCEFGCPCPWAGWRPNQKLTFNQWGSWQQWSQCGATCGPGKRQRCRECAEGSICTGPISETTPCDGGPCVVQPSASWGSWGSWAQCSVTCGRGEEQRMRRCIGGSARECGGVAAEGRDCDMGPCRGYQPEYQWGEWGFWGRCSQTCEGGTQERQRRCKGGSPTDCGGAATDQQSCNEQPCRQEPVRTRPPCFRCQPRTTAAPVTRGVCPWQWTGWSPCMGGCNGVRARQPTCGSCGGTCSAARTNQLRPCNQGCAKATAISQVNNVQPYYPAPAQPYGYVRRYAYGLPGYQNGYVGSGTVYQSGGTVGQAGYYYGGSAGYESVGTLQGRPSSYYNYMGRR